VFFFCRLWHCFHIKQEKESRIVNCGVKKERRRILDILTEQGLASQAVEPLLEVIDRVEQEVKKLEKLLIQRVDGDLMMMMVLMSIMGTVVITAVMVRACVDDIRKFSGYKQFSTHTGLASWVQNSNERERYGSITKRGPEQLRTVLVQMVGGMVCNQGLTLLIV
jgi:transposase